MSNFPVEKDSTSSLHSSLPFLFSSVSTVVVNHALTPPKHVEKCQGPTRIMDHYTLCGPATQSAVNLVVGSCSRKDQHILSLSNLKSANQVHHHMHNLFHPPSSKWSSAPSSPSNTTSVKSAPSKVSYTTSIKSWGLTLQGEDRA